MTPTPVSGPLPTGGAVLGGIGSSDVGRTLAPSDLTLAEQAEHQALDAVAAGIEHRWSSPETGVSGSIVAGDAYGINRTTCRDYTHHVVAGGRTRTLRTTACRQPDGTWRAVSS